MQIAYQGDAGWFLTRYLFEKSDYLRSLFLNQTTANRQKLLAICQLLHFTQGVSQKLSANSDQRPQNLFLSHLRNLLLSGDERVPSLADNSEKNDAIQIMTVHTSKGLEFPIVYVPNLNKDLFPPRNRGSMATLPRQLATGASKRRRRIRGLLPNWACFRR